MLWRVLLFWTDQSQRVRQSKFLDGRSKIDSVIILTLFVMLVISAIGVVWVKHLFAAAMFSGIFSFLSALLFVMLDAVDVAFTEAAVGAGVSTVLVLGTIVLTKRLEQERKVKENLRPLILVILTGMILIYGSLDMPEFGSSNTPAQSHVGLTYLESTPEQIGIPNVVTAVLASYRGFDTLGETAVVFTAGVGVLVLLGGFMRNRRRKDQGEL